MKYFTFHPVPVYVPVRVVLYVKFAETPAMSEGAVNPSDVALK